MIKERLKELDIKITELANYLKISRPTMYKFIDCYDRGKVKEVNPNIKKLFDYIEKNELIGKVNVISYILSEMGNLSTKDASVNADLTKEVTRFINENPDSEKTKFIEAIVKSAKYDLAIHYLLQVMPLLRKKKLLAEEENLVDIYNQIIDLYS